mgnify:FL=1|jgi:hypothetical protein
MARKKKVIEPEIVETSISPIPAQSQIAQKQQDAQLQGTERDIEVYLPKLDKAIETILEAVASLDLEGLTAKLEDPKKLKDLTGALATLNEMRNKITKPQQLSSGQRKKLRVIFGKNQGVEIEQ